VNPAALQYHPVVVKQEMMMDEVELNELSGKIIGAAIEFHRELGPGLLEAMYEDCLADELGRRGIGVQRQVSTPVVYKAANWGHVIGWI
jgi:hypothetical protein